VCRSKKGEEGGEGKESYVEGGRNFRGGEYL